MKKVLCLLLIAAFCLSLFACSASPQGEGPVSGTVPPVSSPASSFPPEFLTRQNAPAYSEELMSECGDLAVTGDLVWRCTHGQILCEDPASGAPAASLPVSALLAEGEKEDYRAIASWSEDTVLLCLCVPGDAGQRRVELLELGLRDGAVTVLARQQAEKELGFLFTGEDQWLEIDMVSNNRRLVFAALDPDFRLLLYRYEPEKDELHALGERTLYEYRAMYPCGEDMLILEPDDEDGTVLKLTRLSLADGAAASLGIIRVASIDSCYNFAYDSAENLLYYTANNLVYAVNARDGETPAAIGRLDGVPSSFRLGTLCASRFVCHDMQGQLLSCATGGDFSVTTLRIADPVGIDFLSEAALGFGLANPEYTVSVVPCPDDTALVSQLQRNPEEYDAFVVRLYSDDWNRLSGDGFVSALSGSRLFSAVGADMPRRMHSALDQDGSLLAYPILVENYCQMIDVPALEALTGVSREKLPTDWTGFLKLLKKIAAGGDLMNQTTYVLYPGGVTVEQFREILLFNILQDYGLQAGEKAADSESLKQLLPVLKAFNEVDWQRMGLAQDSYYDNSEDSAGGAVVSVAGAGAMNQGGGLVADNNAAGSGKAAKESVTASSFSLGTPLLQDAFLDIAVMDVEDGAEFWPLSVREGGERLITQSITLICVNSHSPHREAVVRYLEYLWGETALSSKMLLCRSVNEAVPSTVYEEDLAFFEDRIKKLEQSVAAEKNPAEKELLRAQLKELRSYCERYRKNAMWEVSEQSIAVYRAWQDRMLPVGGMFWDDPSLVGFAYDFLDMVISPKEFIHQMQTLIS